jgi:Domain of unknown function (DUF4350)
LPGPSGEAEAAPNRSWSGREQARRWRGLVTIVAGLAIVSAIALAADQHGSTHGILDPLSYDPDGGRALATLLDDRGVTVTRVTSVEQAMATANSRTTVVVADPDDQPGLASLRGLPGGATLVLVDPGDHSLAAVEPGLLLGGQVDRQTLQPGCTQPDALLAGSIVAGGDAYIQAAGNTAAARTCYSGLLYDQPTAQGGGYIDIGSADALSNNDLGTAGNAALGIGLLSRHPSVLWLVPGPATAPTGGTTPLNDLLPSRLGWAVEQALIAVALLMVWRARRLGRVVPEPLPVVVRASETVEGLGRLYRAGRSRRRAAAVLRAAAVSRVAPRLGLRRDDDRDAIIVAVSSRTGRPAAAVAGLLYGAEPGDDPALVALADQLDALEAEVRRS